MEIKKIVRSLVSERKGRMRRFVGRYRVRKKRRILNLRFFIVLIVLFVRENLLRGLSLWLIKIF